MARKTKYFTVEAENRDQGKTFLITEKDPIASDKWAMRALSALAKSGVELPAGFATAGLAALAALGVRAVLTMPFEDAEPLLDEMLECVAVVPDMNTLDQTTGKPLFRRLNPADIEEVSTIMTLRSEVITLHVGFSVAAFLAKLGETAKLAQPLKRAPTSRKRSPR